MKTTETKTSSALHHKTGPELFFKKNNSNDFFTGKGMPVNTESFFPNTIQSKLKIGRPNDKYEKEADAMADSVVQKLSNPGSVPPKEALENESIQTKTEKEEKNIQRKPVFESDNDTHEFGIQKKSDSLSTTPVFQQQESAEEEGLQEMEEEQEPETLQRTPIFESETTPEVQAKSDHSGTYAKGKLESGLNSSKGKGSALAENTRASMEPAFNSDFSAVRVHTDSSAVQMNKELGAQAFTHGSDIYFNEGKYDTGSSDGQKLLAHELTHVVQQNGSIQRASSSVKPPTQDNDKSTYFYEDKKKGISIDTSKNNITIPYLKVPAFKLKFGPTGGFTLLPKESPEIKNEEGGIATDDFTSPGRSNNQISIWQKELQNSDANNFKEKLDKKAANEKDPKIFDKSGQRIYYFQLKKAGSTSKGLIFGAITEIRQRLFRPFWDSSGKYVKGGYHVDHKQELQLGGPNTISNMWLLEASSNTSSGSKIKAERVHKINQVINKAKTANISNLPSIEKARKEYTLTLTKGLKKGLVVKGKRKTWGIEKVKAGKQLDGLKALKEKEIANLRLRGTAKMLAIYSGRMGGIRKDIPWDDAAAMSKKKILNKKIYIGRTASGTTLIKEVHYDSASNSDGKLVCSVDFNKGKQKKYGVNALENAVFTLKRSDALQYGGYIYKPSIAHALKEAIRFKGLSPVEIHQVNLDPNTGISAIGKIKPTIPFLGNADIDIILNNTGISVRKTFGANEIKLPDPFKIDNTNLEITIGTQNFNANGNINFSIKNVGEGSVKANVNSNGNIKLKGNFDLASELFDKSRISFKYERTNEGEDNYSIEGKISLATGKVKGLKKAEADVQYDDGVLSAKGMAQPDIKGFKEIEMFLKVEKEGYTFGGKTDLVGIVPRIKKGVLELTVGKSGDTNGFQISGGGSVEPDIPGLKGGTSITINYKNGAILIKGKVPFAFDKASAEGEINVGITNRVVDENKQATDEISDEWTVFGSGNVTINLGKGIAAAAEVKLEPNGEIIVSGKVGLDRSKEKPAGKEEKFEKDLFKISPPSIILFAIPPIGASLKLGIEGGARLYAYFTPPHFKELSIKLDNFNLTNPKDDFEIEGNIIIGMSGRGGLLAYLTLKATLSILVAAVEGRLTGNIGMEANAEASASVKAKWSKARGLEIDEGKIEIFTDAKFIAKLKGGIRVFLDLWLAEIDIWEEELDIASIEFGPTIKIGFEMPVSMKDGKLETGALNKDSFKYPDISSEREQQKLVKEGASQDKKVKPPPPPSKEEAIYAVRRLKAGPINAWNILFMDADEARARVAFGLISRDTYIMWLLTKHKTLDWNDAIYVGRQKDRMDFDRFRKYFLAKELSNFQKIIMISNFRKSHTLFSRSNGAEISKLFNEQGQAVKFKPTTEISAENQSRSKKMTPKP